MSPFAFALVATIGALWSSLWNGLAWYRTGVSSYRFMFLLTTVYSVAYVFLWGWLVTHPEADRAAWSELATPFSATSFFTVWAMPAIIDLIRSLDTKQRLRREKNHPHTLADTLQELQERQP